MIDIILHGCNGKMGRVVTSVASADPDINLIAGIDRVPDAFDNPFPVYASLEECPHDCDVIIDFSLPQALPSLLEGALSKKSAIVIATTGLSHRDQEIIESYSKEIPIFQAANMSVGINLMYELIQKAAQVLGDSFDIEIIEKHHNEKIDSPSGTAYALADSINEVFLKSKNYVYGRHSNNDRRDPSDIGIHAFRGGTIVGEHSVIFAGNDEVIEVEHTAYSKQIFAVGAIRAAEYMAHRSPGLYNMKNVMDQRSPITNISLKREIVLVSMDHIPSSLNLISSIYRQFGNEGDYLELIGQPSSDEDFMTVKFAVSKDNLKEATSFCNELKEKEPQITTSLDEDIIKVTIGGLGIERQPAIAAKAFELLSDQHVPLKASITSNTEVNCFINSIYEKETIDTLIEGFFSYYSSMPILAETPSSA